MKSKSKSDAMNIRECMKRNVISIHATATIREAASVMVKHHIGLLPVVDEEKKLIGVVGLRDLLNLELPDFVHFIEDIDFVHDFGAVETTRPPARTLEKPIKSLMEEVETVDEDCGLLRAYAVMAKQNSHDILVVSSDGKLMGIASRVDIGTAILSTWEKVE